MSIAINAKLFSKFETYMEDLHEEIDGGCMESIQKQAARLTKTLAEMRGTAAPAKKGRKSEVNADGTVKEKKAGKPRDPNSPYMKLQTAVKLLYAGISAEDKKTLTSLGFGYLKLCGYFNALGKMEPTEHDMAAAVAYLKEHPEYTSKTQVQRSATASQASGEAGEKKPRGRRPKKASAAQAADAPASHVSEIVAQIEKHIAEEDESDDESDDDEEEDSERVPLEPFEYKSQNYLKDPYQEVYTSEGKMEWVGTFNGKKIVMGQMPIRVKKFLESTD